MVDKRHEARNTKLAKALQGAQQVPCNAPECKQKSAIESLQQELAEAQAALASQAIETECVPEGYQLVPIEVLNLYRFMVSSFIPLTSQQEQIMISLDKAKTAMLEAAKLRKLENDHE